MRDKSSSVTSFRESLTFFIHETRCTILCCFHTDLMVCAYLEAMVTKEAATYYYLIAFHKKDLINIEYAIGLNKDKNTI